MDKQLQWALFEYINSSHFVLWEGAKVSLERISELSAQMIQYGVFVSILYSIIGTSLLVGGVWILYRLYKARKLFKLGDIGILVSVGLIFIVVAGISLLIESGLIAITLITNPDYWVLQQLVHTLKNG